PPGDPGLSGRRRRVRDPQRGPRVRPGDRDPDGRRGQANPAGQAGPGPGLEAYLGGIAGCYQQTDGHKLVDLMADRIAHRGPDAAGRWDYEDDRVAVQLGQRRLAVIAPSAVTGPLTKAGLTLVYDGELYNAPDLRTELTARGVGF